MTHGFGGVEVLGEGHRDSGGSKLGYETGEKIEHGGGVLKLS
jgi:hypothetical protein